tara:strand:- start:3174 stop:4055 length:882 start_codon:yes stop_codon:yes gene_type:complete
MSPVYSKESYFSVSLKSHIESFFKEDDLDRNIFYNQEIPDELVECSLKFKTNNTLISGLPFFMESFIFLGAEKSCFEDLGPYEGRRAKFEEGEDAYTLKFVLPFSIALSGERIALNLLQRSSNIATYTSKFVTLAEAKGISILDTRKTMPGLRFLDKYSVRVGGGKNHRFGQTDVWMIKDNHKSYFGGLQEAISFFKKMGSFYNPLVVEVHSLDEFEKANSMGVKHFMLDNFKPGEIKEALKSKKEGTTIEVSGGIHLGILENYLIEGVDAISIGALTHSPETVDISLKMKRL